MREGPGQAAMEWALLALVIVAVWAWVPVKG
jgi:ABC-type sugar transport system permease subunit